MVALLLILSSLLANDVRGAFTAAGTYACTASSRPRAVAGTGASAFTERPSQMRGAVGPATELRMRGPCSPNSLNREPSSSLRSDENRKRRTIRLRHPQQSALSTLTNDYPWRQRPASKRSGTSLRASSEDAFNFDHENEQSRADAEMGVSVGTMERGSNSTDAAPAVEADGAAIEASPPSIAGTPLASILILNLVAVVWGTQHAVIKSVVDDASTTLRVGAGLTTGMEQLGLHLGTFQNSAGAGGENAAAYFTLARFGLAALLAAPYTPGLSRVTQKLGFRTTTAPVNGVADRQSGGEVAAAASYPNAHTADQDSVKLAWKYGAELGVYMFLGYAFQAIGLETTTASRSGFLLYLNVKFVPFLAYFLFGKQIKPITWISALVAFSGTALLAFDNATASGGTENGLAMAFNVGDLWSIAAAVASALFILRMEAASKAVPKSSELNAANLWTVAALSLLWTLGNSLQSAGVDAASSPASFVPALQHTFQRTCATITAHPVQLVYLAGVTTALANFLQSKAQKDVSAERASVIYALDPVYGALFANLLLGETLGGLGLVGAAFILVAAATNAVLDLSGEGEGSSRGTEKR